MKPDLHCHSYFSDGKHPPDFLLKRAAENNVTHLAITDHDCTTAFEKPIVSDYGVKLIAGVEISCQWNNQEIHLVGLGIDYKNPALQSLLGNQQTLRRSRVTLMADLLHQNGVDGLLQYLKKLPCTVYTRSHVADFLIQYGKVKNKQKAFKQFLGRKGKAYVAFQWQSLEKVIETIKRASGLTVLAHPGRYFLNNRKLEELVTHFAEMGGNAMEVSYGGITPLMQNRLEKLAEASSLYISMGSDFHDTEAHWTDIGKYPSPSSTAKNNAIWNHPRCYFR